MPRKSKASEFEEMRDAGMGLASKLVLEHKYDLAKDVFTKLLNLRPDDVEVMALHANVFIVEGKLLEAENRLTQVLAFNPNYPLALYFLGVVYHDKGEFEKAIHMYETALKFFPEKDKKDIADVYQNLGCSLWRSGAEEALEAWKSCLKYNLSRNTHGRTSKSSSMSMGWESHLLAWMIFGHLLILSERNTYQLRGEIILRYR